MNVQTRVGKYPLSKFDVENIPKVFLDIDLESKFGTDKCSGIPSLSEPCSEQFIENKLVFELNCKHAFQISCTGTWLMKKAHCPHCEESVVCHGQLGMTYEMTCSNYGYKYVDITYPPVNCLPEFI
ncbi:hypothetical protein HELRODRAFT_173797 [Helobdella robusta]|uniref:RING-type domain-containing protein n=1 Tax=Helobdella robusta TaxID=6412 RepID=T1F786_HELRO|nr:hypothetical protein HELRODRAFT_173797 [Helobdella robusta]ESO03493.1 hypothetical protein HELRODRAFT_173797 [Helobdella robusta]